MNLQRGFFRIWIIGSVCWLAFMILFLYSEYHAIKMDAYWTMNETLTICENLPPDSIAKGATVTDLNELAFNNSHNAKYFDYYVDEEYILLYTCMDKPISETTTEEQLDYIHKIQNKYAIQYMLQPSSSLLNAYLFFILPPFLLIFLFMIIQWIVRGFKK